VALLSLRCHGRAGLINIRSLDPEIVVDMPYAGENNFTGRKLYQANEAFLIEPAARALASAAADLAKLGYRLKVLDAYRPLSVQSILWSIKPDANFVASPKVGSKHNRGASVDVTLLTSDLKPVEMPSLYDEFGPKARAVGQKLPDGIRKNLETLQKVMTGNGFKILASEWWHFDYKDGRLFPLLDIPFSELSD